MSRTTALVEHLDHFGRRVIIDAFLEATAAYWDRRAETFDAVGTPECAEIAEACRNRASLAIFDDLPELDDVLAEGGEVA